MPHTESTREAFSHEAFVYGAGEEFLAGVLPFLREGLEAGEPMLVVLGAPKNDLLRTELGRDAGRVGFADMGEVGANPARIIPVWRRFVDARSASGGPIRGIGEPIFAARSSAELVECQQHEALLDQAFAGTCSFRLLCPYDAALGPDVLEEAHRSHPFVYSVAGRDPSTGWDAAGAVPRPFQTPLPEPAAVPDELGFTDGQLQELRRFSARHAIDAGLDAEQTADVVLAVNEVATNSLRHGGRRGTLRVWREGPTLVCEIRDTGTIADPLVGRRQPNPHQPGGFGLWLVNHLCDLVQVRTGPAGSVVRMHVKPRCAFNGRVSGPVRSPS